MAVVYSMLTDVTALLIGGTVMGFYVNDMLGGYGALMSELYPTAARATAQNVLFNVGRAIGGFGPVAVGAMSAAYGFKTAIAMLALLYVIDIIALIPERRGAARTRPCKADGQDAHPDCRLSTLARARVREPHETQSVVVARNKRPSNHQSCWTAEAGTIATQHDKPHPAADAPGMALFRTMYAKRRLRCPENQDLLL